MYSTFVTLLNSFIEPSATIICKSRYKSTILIVSYQYALRIFFLQCVQRGSMQIMYRKCGANFCYIDFTDVEIWLALVGAYDEEFSLRFWHYFIYTSWIFSIKHKLFLPLFNKNLLSSHSNWSWSRNHSMLKKSLKIESKTKWLE